MPHTLTVVLSTLLNTWINFRVSVDGHQSQLRSKLKGSRLLALRLPVMCMTTSNGADLRGLQYDSKDVFVSCNQSNPAHWSAVHKAAALVLHTVIFAFTRKVWAAIDCKVLAPKCVMSYHMLPFSLICSSPQMPANAFQMILIYFDNPRYDRHYWDPTRMYTHVQKVVTSLSAVIRRLLGFLWCGGGNVTF